jgi:hypothetical protein
MYNNNPKYFNMSDDLTGKFSDPDIADRYHLTYQMRLHSTDAWATDITTWLFHIVLNANNTMSIYTKPNMNGQIPVYFNATDAKGSSVIPTSPVPIKVNAINDVPNIKNVS